MAVFDLAGTVADFIRAAGQIEGLEFLADLRDSMADADEEFFYEADGEPTEDAVPQSLYMVMTNAHAVEQLVRLFELWQDDQTITFATGLNPLKQVFRLLRALRRWGPEDRIRETGLLNQWAEDVAVVRAQGTTRVEVELWFRADERARAAAERDVSEVLERNGGQVIASSQHTDIRYHGVLADVPLSQVEMVLAEGPESIELLTTETIMFVNPVRPMSIPGPESSPEAELQFDEALPTGRPRVAVLDGVPLANHVALRGRLIVDDPDGRTERYTATQRCHATAMTSLIAHGDLCQPSQALRQPLYVRPILVPHEHLDRHEVVPPDELFVDLVHRAFHRIFAGDGTAEAAAPSIRIVNFSVGDPRRVFVRRLSPLARLLDWLAHRYNLLIVVSAGNHLGVRPEVPAAALADGRSAVAAVAESLHESTRHRRLLSPAEAVNVITVGAMHEDGFTEELPDTLLDLIPRGAPAPYSPAGFGFRRSVKPDVLLPGGRQVFQRPPTDSSDRIALAAAQTIATGPGVCVATPGVAGGNSAIGFTCGTSNAAALATRSVSRIFDILDELRSEAEDSPFPDAQYDPVLAKTLLIHAAGWHDLRGELQNLLGLPGTSTRRDLTKLLGYGPVKGDRLGTADRVRAVLIGAGSIEKDQRHTYRFPLPALLSASVEWRRLTVTLGWISPINVQSQKYRMARLRFTVPRADLATAPIEADHNAILKGTLQHEVLEGRAAVAYMDGTSLAIDVDCRADGGTLPSPVRYGLAASLEVASSVRVDLHEQVRMGLQAQVRARTRAAGQGT